MNWTREDDVVRDHRRVQAQPLAFACQGENAAARSGRAAGREIEAVAHSAGSLFHSRQPGNGRARGTSMARPQHAVRIVQAVRAGIGLQ